MPSAPKAGRMYAIVYTNLKDAQRSLAGHKFGGSWSTRIVEVYERPVPKRAKEQKRRKKR